MCVLCNQKAHDDPKGAKHTIGDEEAHNSHGLTSRFWDQADLHVSRRVAVSDTGPLAQSTRCCGASATSTMRGSPCRVRLYPALALHLTHLKRTTRRGTTRSSIRANPL